MENNEEYFNPDIKKSINAVKNYKRYSKNYPLISLIIFGVILVTVTAVLIFFERPEKSEIEKRELAKRPEFSVETFFSGEFTDNFSVYFADTVPFRESLVDLSSQLKKLRGVSSPTFYGSVQIVADDDGSSIETEPPVTEIVTVPSETTTIVVTDENNNTSIVTEATTVPVTTTEITTTTEEEEVKDIAEFSNNGIVVDGVKMYGEDAGIMLFGGNKPEGKRYAEIINMYAAALEGVQVHNLVVPTSAEFYLPKRFSKYSSSEKDAINHIYSCLDPSVNTVDAYSMIEKHTDEYIYLRTDHHWSPLGAYYAYAAFAEDLGMEYPDISEYEEKVKYDYVGSLYGYTNDVTLKNAPEEFHYFKPQNVDYTTYYYQYDNLASLGQSVLFHEYVEGGNCYGMFLGKDGIHTKIVTDAANGRKIVVFKESYGNAFVPHLVSNFEEIYVIDIRYFGRNAVEYIKEIGATDVLFINNIFAANTAKLVDGILRLYQSETGTVITTVPVTEPPVTDENGNTVTTSKKASTKKTGKTETTEKPKSTEKPKKPAQTEAPKTEATEPVTVTAN